LGEHLNAQFQADLDELHTRLGQAIHPTTWWSDPVLLADCRNTIDDLLGMYLAERSTADALADALQKWSTINAEDLSAYIAWRKSRDG
jgi:hypothetical protein